VVEEPKLNELGNGPDSGGDQYDRIHENPFYEAVGERAVSTFSIDVDRASYANVRQFLMQSSRMPPPDAVRIEELVNYFDYAYTPPESENGEPFAAHVEVAGCPWAPEHRLVRIGIKGRELDADKRPQSNLVFLLDVSGSMNHANKLPLVVEGMKALTRQLGENDRVAIVVYASSEGLVLPSTPGTEQEVILGSLDQLRAGGSTAGGAGIQLAYQIAEDNFIEGGVNRVILCTDGDFNVGTTSSAELERMVEQKAKDTRVFLSVLGFGRGNLNDAMMETISNRGNGNYHYVDSRNESRRVLVEEMTGMLVTIAKDVKIQVFFNPAQVGGYRLIGYENRMLRTQDFNDDTKDAGEIGAGHTVTALYEIVPAGEKVDAPSVDESPYVTTSAPTADIDRSGELLTLRMRYKQPDGDTSTLREWPVTDAGNAFSAASGDFKFASAVASFGMLLRDSQHRGNATWDAVAEIAGEGVGDDPHGRRAEFLTLVERAKELNGE
jgi:Ca-activated chloride channel family protein